MIKPTLRLFLMMVASSIGGPAAWGSAFYSPLYSANQLVTRSSLTIYRNADTVTINPAAVGFLSTGWRVSAGLALEDRDFKWSGDFVDPQLKTVKGFDASNDIDQINTKTDQIFVDRYGSAQTSTPLRIVPGFQTVYMGKHWGYGFALKTPFDSTIHWADSWGGSATVERESIRTFGFNNNLIYKISKNQSVSIGHSIYLTRYFHQRSTADGSKKHITARGSSWSNHLESSYLGFVGNFSLGANFHGVLPVKMTGEMELDADGDLFGIRTETTVVSIEFGLPYIAEMGLGWKNNRKNPQYELEVGLLKAGWSSFHKIGIKLDDPLRIARNFDGRENEHIDTNLSFKDSLSLRSGFHWHITDSNILMLGAEFGDRATQSAYLSPAYPIANELVLAVGNEFVIDPGNRVSFGLAWTYFTETTREANEDQIQDPIARFPQTGTYSGNARSGAVTYHSQF